MAADKTQNININYNFNTAQVERAKSLMQQADQANQKFQKSGQAAGQAVNSAFKTTTASIETLRGKVEVLREQIIRANDPKVVKRLSDEYKKLKTQLDAATKSAFNLKNAQDQVAKATKATADSTGQLSKGLGNLYNGVRLFLAAGLLRETVNTAIEMATLAGNIESVSRAFNRLPNSILLLDDLRESTHGTVSDFELMRQALQAKNFGLPVEKLGKLLEFATVKAQQTGLSIDYITNSLVTGLGRKSERVFDNLQLDIAELRKRIASGLDFRTAGIQLITEDLERMGGVVETSATKVDQLTVSWQKLKAEVATSSSKDGGFISFLNDLVEGARMMMKGQRGVILEGITEESIKLAKEFIKSISGQDVANRIENTQQKMNSLQQAIGRYNDMISDAKRDVSAGDGFGLPGFSSKNIEGAKKWNETVQQYGKRAHDIFNQEIEDARKRLTSLQVNKKVLEETIVILKQYFATLEAAPEVEESFGLIEAKLKEIEEAGDRLKAAKTTGEIHNINNELARLNGELADLQAFGTTKQFLTVNGKIKLVPVTEPKDLQKYHVDLENALGALETKIKVTLDFERPDSKVIMREMFGQGEDIRMRQEIPTPNPTSQQKAVFEPTFWDKIGDEFSENWKGILGQGLDDTANFFNSVIQADADQYDARLQQSKDFYDKQMTLAGDNETFKERLRLREANEERKLRMQAFEADKRAKKSQAAINGAVAITNAFATLGPIAGAVAAVVIAASTLAQIAAIDREKPRFAKGILNLKGPGTGKSDSIDAKLSRGESVMTAEETRKSFGILKSIRAKTLDDKVLEDLRLGRDGVSYGGGMSDKRIVKELQTLRSSIPDYGEKYGVLWRTTSRSETYRKMVRAKTM